MVYDGKGNIIDSGTGIGKSNLLDGNHTKVLWLYAGIAIVVGIVIYFLIKK